MKINISATSDQKIKYDRLIQSNNLQNGDWQNPYEEEGCPCATVIFNGSEFIFNFAKIIDESYYSVIPPYVAAALYATQYCNRQCDIRHVDELIFGMKNNNSCSELNRLILAKDNRLIDGQHTLLSIIRSNIATKVLILKLNLEYTEVVKFLDQNKKQTLPQTLTRCGYKNTMLLAIIIKAIKYYDDTKQTICSKKALPTSDSEIINHYENNYKSYINEPFLNNLKKFFKCGGSTLKCKPIVVALSYMHIFNDDAYEYFKKEYINTEKTSSLTNLREVIDKIINQRLFTGDDLHDTIFQLLIVGWNHLISDNPETLSKKYFLGLAYSSNVIQRNNRFLIDQHKYYA